MGGSFSDEVTNKTKTKLPASDRLYNAYTTFCEMRDRVTDLSTHLDSNAEFLKEQIEDVRKGEADFAYQYEYNHQLIEQLSTKDQECEAKLADLKNQFGLELLQSHQREQKSEESRKSMRGLLIAALLSCAVFNVAMNTDFVGKVVDKIKAHAIMQK